MELKVLKKKSVHLTTADGLAVKAVSPMWSHKPVVGGNNNNNNQSKMPTFGTQVTVMRQEEKDLLKMQMKQEKKMKRKNGTRGDEEEEDDDEGDEAVKQLIEQELLEARSRPLFTPSQPVKLPNVFDSMQEIKQMPGTVGGTKIMLPLNTERFQAKEWEEVRIPVSPALPNGIEKRKLIRINELDEVGKLGFRGLKTLNLIQSIVFDTAYNKSENMLICAPTGAGKTNVALLTVLSLVKQFSTLSSKGVHVNKELFKIVYVAPMKALAAEMVSTFSKKLEPFKMLVRELTGDMQLTKTEIMQTSMIVTTPEKWDVVTRKPGEIFKIAKFLLLGGDSALISLVKLLIIDEVHLLHGDRGPVVEALVARTKRQVEAAQVPIRVVGLSATLPNYLDVARFLWVKPETGLFFFDSRFRPVPLGMTFIGVKSLNTMQQAKEMDSACYEQVKRFVQNGQQVMVFVHARNATVRAATLMRDTAVSTGQAEIFKSEQNAAFSNAQKAVQKSKNKQLRELFDYGFAMHHAGMLRPDRSMVERLFADGYIKVLVCTSTLAWGVNLPAHAVVIRGTEIYDAKYGSFVQLSILDVMQIFGRAGRPQFDTSGHGVIITTHDKLSHFLSLLTRQFPIESSFLNLLADNLNAEVALGTVTNLREAVEWLSYTYLYVRMLKNPMAYGIRYDELEKDPNLVIEREKQIRVAAMALDKARMIRFDEALGYMHSTDTGRIASTFYVKYATIEIFNELLTPFLNEAQLLGTISKAEEFNQIKVRDEELDELDHCKAEWCDLPVPGGSENSYGKVNILLQSHVSQHRLEAFSLVSDQAYVIQNAQRIARALFEIVLHKNWPTLTIRTLTFAKVLERQMWAYEHPLRQLSGIVAPEVLDKLDQWKVPIEELRYMDTKEIGQFPARLQVPSRKPSGSEMLHHQRAALDVKRAAWYVPCIELSATVQPITRTVLRVRVSVLADFTWSERVHGRSGEPFWLWVEDPETNHTYHHESFLLTRKHLVGKSGKDDGQRGKDGKEDSGLQLAFTIPVTEPMPSQYLIRCVSDRWLGVEAVCALSFARLILPERHPPHTVLLDLIPLSIRTVLSDVDPAVLQALYPKMSHLNPIQTQMFHLLYHTDKNVLLGAPTGSGKTVVAELAMLRVFGTKPKGADKVVYIAPMKALVRERMQDWGVRLPSKRIVELTGDVTPDARAINDAHIIVTTPEKWDGISRSWQTRQYVQAVALIILDEIHLLGEDRGPVLEVIVSRTSFIAAHTQRSLRIVGLSTALANAQDLAAWIGVDGPGLYNFRPSVRPVPLEVHIQGFSGEIYRGQCRGTRGLSQFCLALSISGVYKKIHHVADAILRVWVFFFRFVEKISDLLHDDQLKLSTSGKHYCPRMLTMNKPTFQAIMTHSPDKPTLVFVASRRQTRLTAMDLITFLAAESNPRQWLRCDERRMNNLLQNVRDQNLKVTLSFGVGIHHAGLHEQDRRLVEELFVSQQIQVRLHYFIYYFIFKSVVLLGRNLHNSIISPVSPFESEAAKIRVLCCENRPPHFLSQCGLYLEYWPHQHSGVAFFAKNWGVDPHVLVATATLAWGVNFPAHLVVVKGTEYFDGKTKRYVDFPITDVLQMMGRAGRPQFDDQGIAVVMVHDLKKAFYKKFLYEPFPVESSLLAVLSDHMNAEIVAGTVTSKQDCLDYLTWTFFFRRLLENPSYYGLESLEPENVNVHLSGLVDKSVRELEESGCLELDEDGRTLHATVAGRIASLYYLSHKTLALFQDRLRSDCTLEDLLRLLSDVQEYAELPVRHNEDLQNADLAKLCRIKLDSSSMDSAHTKAHLLFQARFSRLPLPNSEYETDLKSVLDQAIRIIQAMLDVSSEKGLLATALRVQNLLQMIIQARWQKMIDGGKQRIDSLPKLLLRMSECGENEAYETLAHALRKDDSLDEAGVEAVFDAVCRLPLIQLDAVTLIPSSSSSYSSKEDKCEEIPVDVPIEGKSQTSTAKMNWTTIACGTEYTLRVKVRRRAGHAKMRHSQRAVQKTHRGFSGGDGVFDSDKKGSDRRNAGGNNKWNTAAVTPAWNKGKDEGWFLVLGCVDSGELLGLKRVGYIATRATFHLTFHTPPAPGRLLLTLYLVSDSYLGLDQQFDIPLQLDPSRSQDNPGNDEEDDFHMEDAKAPAWNGSQRKDEEVEQEFRDKEEEFWLAFGSK
ncbi:unnamed protein product [Notodromas monacha]|uniref:U5 small nuclear ribonucleoprotein 200 kDa helicase n=1 Tax=Notodromas monacha TaxID=399045 RepID=A0A7R9BHU5_9CRUS|nr:unnamed protein product [Notodromas monacha]CAG0914937.1 unnamed protein product [Notodromas monacha]